jgi:hypothetical protein
MLFVKVGMHFTQNDLRKKLSKILEEIRSGLKLIWSFRFIPSVFFLLRWIVLPSSLLLLMWYSVSFNFLLCNFHLVCYLFVL